MIREGRSVVERTDLPRILGKSDYRVRTEQEWNTKKEFPPPVTPKDARSKLLWDEQQILAYADDKPVPPIPQVDSPGDLLNSRDLAEMLGLARKTIHGLWRDGYLEGQDVRGVPHTRRDVAEAFAARERHAGKGKGTRGKAQDQVMDEITRLAKRGEVPTIDALMRATGRSRPIVTAARKRYRELHGEDSLPAAGRRATSARWAEHDEHDEHDD